MPAEIRRDGKRRRAASSRCSEVPVPFETVIPVKLRTARVPHRCGQCRQVIEPGELYEVHALPPYREPNGGAGWWVMATHVAAYPIRRGCDEAAAYREQAEREQASA